MQDADSLEEEAIQWARHARDAAYVAVGLGVLGFQRIQTARRVIRHVATVDEQASHLAGQMLSGLRAVETRIRQVVTSTG